MSLHVRSGSPSGGIHTEALSDREAALARADAALARARLAYNAARVEFSREAWAFHDSAVAARAEVKVQFGPDAHEVHAVGLKCASERKRPARRATAPSA